jgi:hypothetical protein
MFSSISFKGSEGRRVDGEWQLQDLRVQAGLTWCVPSWWWQGWGGGVVEIRISLIVDRSSSIHPKQHKRLDSVKSTDVRE